MNEELLNKVSNKTNVDKNLLTSLAEKLSKGNMKDEKTLDEIIDTLSIATGKSVSPELKDKIKKTIKEDKVPNNIDNMF